jgi:hypothetical protein
MRTAFGVWGLACALLILCGGPLTAHAGDTLHTRQGVLTAVDFQHDTIVVEIPVNGREMTVAGPLAAGARVTVEGQTAGLDFLEVGKTVTVTWKRTPEGPHILAVRQR